MAEYRRVWLPDPRGFHGELAERRRNRLLVARIDVLRTPFRNVGARHPFHLEAVVILPGHLHCVWTLAPRRRFTSLFAAAAGFDPQPV
jgi:putative transposase